MNDRTDHQPPFQPPTQTPPQLFAPPKKRRRWVHWIVYPIVFLTGLAIGAAGGGANTTSSTPGATVTVTATPAPGAKVTVTAPAEPAKTVTAQPAGPSDTIDDDGTWLVGSEVKPGTYRSQNFGDCYWARLRSTDGGINAIIDNGIGPNQTVTIKRTDKAFETARCGVWKRIR